MYTLTILIEVLFCASLYKIMFSQKYKTKETQQAWFGMFALGVLCNLALIIYLMVKYLP